MDVDELSPEDIDRLREWMGYGSAGEKIPAVQDEIDKATKMMDVQPQQHITPGGAIAGGLADAMMRARGAMDARAGRQERHDLLDKREKGVQNRIDVLKSILKRQQAGKDAYAQDAYGPGVEPSQKLDDVPRGYPAGGLGY